MTQGPTVVTFTVLGIPAPQGSKQAFTAANGQARMKEAGGLRFAAWRNAVAESARRAADQLGTPLDGPIALNVEFRFPMPTSRPAAARKAGITYKTTAPDLSKLIRAIEDSLTAARLITDDARICKLTAYKYECVDLPLGATINVTAIDDIDPVMVKFAEWFARSPVTT